MGTSASDNRTTPAKVEPFKASTANDLGSAKIGFKRATETFYGVDGSGSSAFADLFAPVAPRGGRYLWIIKFDARSSQAPAVVSILAAKNLPKLSGGFWSVCRRAEQRRQPWLTSLLISSSD